MSHITYTTACEKLSGSKFKIKISHNDGIERKKKPASNWYKSDGDLIVELPSTHINVRYDQGSVIEILHKGSIYDKSDIEDM